MKTKIAMGRESLRENDMTRNHKRSNVDTGNVVDILVTLPRELIHTILDWAPVRDVARTSILSTKWRYIWSEHPRLILDKPFFEANFKNKRAPVDSYVNAINSIILLHNGPVQKFHLYIPNEQSDMNQHVFQWLVYLSRNGITNIILDNHHVSPCTLPSHVLSHPGLEYSTLRNCIVKMPKEFGGFSKLAYLFLSNLSFTPEILGNVVAPAPALKHLTFFRCTGIQHFKIHSPKLDTFTIVESSDVQLTNYGSIPDLTALRIILGNTVPDQKHQMPLNLIHFLQRFPKLEELQLDDFFLKLLAAATIPEQISTTFDQLTYLNLMDLNFNNVDEMLCLQGLLKSCPNIEELNIWARSLGDGSREQSAAIDSVTSSKCGRRTLSKLTTVSISHIKGLTTELGFIEMLLASAPILKQMSVHYQGTMDAIKKFQISSKLLDFTRASTEARIKCMEEAQNLCFRKPFVSS